MNLEFLALGGYGQYVWSAFIFTAVSCLSLYIKTKKEFNKQEKIFLIKVKQDNNANIKVIEKDKEQTLSGSLI